MSKKYLFVVRGYYPELSASGNLIKPLLERLAVDNEIHVLCFSSRISEPTCSENIKVFRIPLPSSNRFKDFITNRLSAKSEKYSLVVAAKREIERLDSIEVYEHIVSVTFEESCALLNSNIDKSKKIALFLEKPPNSGLFGIIRKLKDHSNKQVFLSMLKNMESVICLPILRKYLERNNFNPERVDFIEHPMVSNRCKEREGGSNPRALLLYAGGIDRTQRNPLMALNFLCGLEQDLNIEFYSYGNILTSLKKKKLKNVSFNEPVDSSELEHYYQQADFLITIGNVQVDIMPSKIFDCISTGIPIIHFSKSKDDPCLEYLAKYKFALTLQESELSLRRDKLISFIDEMKGKRADYSYIQNTFSHCTAETNALLLEKYIKK
ncbi:hypothetical protein [Pseudoalteromonas sp. OANN1]|uniref:hypothetical protein n=1 Tax=Pseudoalteromonas sp. OANN1 TaxID=2954497 RepID=UPI00209703E1|nr:hypothetical protein [Pseudoalteromonas sp. OANN1]MCO7198252.1 hypothetical protein [Pseudoalteromonas sp. OANN1]